MKSMSQYKEELNEIASRFGYSGTVTEYLTSIIAYGIYESSLNHSVLLNESNPDKANNINSQIDYAMSQLYSVFRGRNNILKVNVTANSSKIIKAFDLLYSGKGFNVYALKDVDAVTPNTVRDIECIIASSVKELSSPVRKSYYLDFQASDISEDIYLYESGGGISSEEYSYKPFTNLISDLLDKNTVLGVTSYDFGIRFFFSDKIPENKNYKIKYFEYTPLELNLSSFDKFNIPGFDINVDESGKKKMTLEKYLKRDDTKSGIGTRAKINLVAQSRVRSYTDITGVFDQYFADKSLGSGMEVVSTKSGDSTVSTLIIYYIPKNEGVSIPESELNEFLKLFSPYINSKVEFRLAEQVELYIDCTVYSDANISKDPIYNLFLSKSNRMEEFINRFSLMAEVNNTDANIKYSEIILRTKELVQMDSYQLSSSQYAKLNVSTLIMKTV